MVGEVDSVVRRGMEMSSEVVDVGDSGLSTFTRSSIFCLLLLLSLRIASIEKDPRLLFSPISSEQMSSTGLLFSIPFLLYPHHPLLLPSPPSISPYSSPPIRCRSEASATPINGRRGRRRGGASGAGPWPHHNTAMLSMIYPKLFGCKLSTGHWAVGRS